MMGNTQGFLFAVAPGTAPHNAAPDHGAMPDGDRPNAPDEKRQPEDLAARRDAIDTTRSILVQAPAGAGKTNLLTQRYLALLADENVEEPEQILAVTFTRAATAEMRNRIVEALEAAERTPVPEPGEDPAMPLARAALRHAKSLNWRLLEQPHRLDVQTIDSLCLRLAHGQPLLARLGGALQPTEDASALYSMAARRTTALLGRRNDPDLENALKTLLLRRDNSLNEVEKLLAAMLARRDTWLSVLPLRFNDTVDWEAVKQHLEQPFADENNRVLGSLLATMDAMPGLAQELLELARYSAGNIDVVNGSDPNRDPNRGPDREPDREPDLRLLQTLEAMPGAAAEHRDRWLALAHLLLTKESEWRKTWTAAQGFPAPGTASSTGSGSDSRPGKERRRDFKERMKGCCQALQAHPRGGPSLQQLLCRLRGLPPLGYTGDQWTTLLAVFRVLRRAAAELRLVFAEENAVDFVEIAAAAQSVVEDETSMRGLLESEHKRHLLIDEFQDTSRTQYRLVAELLREWSEGDKRTAFVVGDPLQSIYGFRAAEVALFHETRAHGLPCGNGRRHLCHTLQLTHNFRSHSALVEPLNECFEKIFAGSLSDTFTDTFADTFVPAHAWPEAGTEESLQLHTFFTDRFTNRSDEPDQAEIPEQAGQQEAAEVVRILGEELGRIRAAEARGDKEYKVAVLVRSRSHLSAILPALRAAGIPFRAVDLEPLADQPEVHDLLMLLRALLHPSDRSAWLSVLRAPWCGLLLRDLHVLVGNDDPSLLSRAIPELIETRTDLLSPDGQARLGRTWQVLSQALHTRYSGGNNFSLSAWVERTWMALGGPACGDATARENAEAFLRLLDGLEPSGVEVLRGDFALRLAKLCAAPNTQGSERFSIQLMTMHKAKGLGFQVVLLPGLERKSRSDETELLAILERAHPDRTHLEHTHPDRLPSNRPDELLPDELLVAPMGSREDAEGDKTYRWVMAQRKRRDSEERKRLFYVACTRARTRLHLFATVGVKEGEVQRPKEGSLLAAAWPALEQEVQARQLQPSPSETGLTLAASAAAATSAAAPATSVRQTVERLPSSWIPAAWAPDVRVPTVAAPIRPLFARTEGSPAVRARGTAMHALLERLTLLFADSGALPHELETWRGDLERTAERILRQSAYGREAAHATAAELCRGALAVAASDTGRWLLQPHPGALTESTWQTWDAGGILRTLRVDRSFLAGSSPGENGATHLWIVDYKTGTEATRFPPGPERKAWLGREKEHWQPQLEAYGAALTSAWENKLPLRYGLYFPELLELVHWQPNEG